MFDLLKRDPNAPQTGNPTTEYVRFFAGLDGKPKLKDSSGTVLDFQSRAFISITANTGTATAEIVDDTLSLTGVNGISTSATDSPDAIVITPTYGSPVGLAPDGANAAGTANTFARSDHVHATPTDTAVGLNGGTASGEGTSASFARADHTHAIANGGTPTTITPNAAANQGASTAFARHDHTHAIATAAAVALTFASTNTEGASASFARADHTHAITVLRSTRATEFLSTANNATVQAVQSLVVPAARIVAGLSVRFELAGAQTNAATAGGNNNVILQVNGTTIATATVAVGATAQTNRSFVASGILTFRSTTQVVGSVRQEITAVAAVNATNAAAPTTITAGDATITISVQTATANAGNTIRVGNVTIAEV